MRGRAAFAAGLIVLLAFAVGAATAWVLWDSERVEATSPPDGDVAARSAALPAKSVSRRGSRRRPLTEPAVDVDAELTSAWEAALALYKSGKPVEALKSLVQLRKDHPEWFAEPTRAALLAEMERAALAALSRVARTGTLADARKLEATLREVVLDPALLQQAADLLAAAERRAAAAQMSPGAMVVEQADVLADKQALARHLQRFADRGAAPKTKDWIDTQLAAVEAANKILTKEPDPLPIPDPTDAEKRRLDQLDKLRQRNAAGLLDPIDGALAWLALHQADDGHFGADASNARCKVLGHDPTCILDKDAKENFPLAATGLAVLAFLDFRDQDVKRLFEPTLSRGIRWIVEQQQADGSFKPAGSNGYSWAIGLMAMGQAATTTRDPRLLEGVQRGINFYAKHPGKNGGYRYRLDQDGDLSVTGWFAQAAEAATNAGAEVPKEMKDGLGRFIDAVWRSPPRSAFTYTVDTGSWPTMNPVGMLVMTILRPDSPQLFGDEWRDWLVTSKTGANSVYFLYYGVRVLLFLDGKVPDAWRGRLAGLAAKQSKTGPSAGLIDLKDDGHFKRERGIGPTIATAFATLTLEHSLYRR